MEYRRITPADLTEDVLDRMEELELRCGLEPYTRQMLLECVNAMDTMGVFLGNLLIGFSTVGWTKWYCGGSLYLVNVNVAPEFRGRGVGRKLICAHLHQYLPRFSGVMVSLDVAKSNQARALYERLGFAVMDTPSRNGPEDLVMAAQLEQILNGVS